MRDAIEFEEPVESLCDCCESKTTRLTRFVTRDGNAFAVYFAVFSDGPHGGWVGVLVGFGPWEEEADQAERTAFAFRIWTSGDHFQVGLVDAEEDDWTTDFLGRKLSREEALAHPLRQEVFDLSDHIVECDEPIIRHLEDWAAAGSA